MKLMSYRKAPNAGAADKVLRNRAAFGPRQWTSLLNELAKKKQARWALLVLDWMACNGAEPNIIHYNCVISACEKEGQWKKALALLDEVKEREGIEPDVRTYSAAISACEKGGQWEQALVLLDEVKEREGIDPNVLTYSAAISACAKGGQWEQALALLEEAKNREGIKPNEITYNAAISACAKGGQWEQALALLEEAKNREGIKPNEITYSAALDAVRDQPLMARALYLEALDLRIYRPPSSRTTKLWKFDLHEHSEGAAITAARWWIETKVIPWHFGEGASAGVSLGLVTGYGKSRQAWKTGELSGGDVKAAVTELLLDMEVPIDETNRNPGSLVIDRTRWRQHEKATRITE
jgi:pentatricopeptide repeat protein